MPFLIILVLTPFFIALQVYFLVRKMSEPEKMLILLPNGLSPGRQQIVDQHLPWLNSMQLDPLPAHKFGTIEVATFQQRGTQRFLSIMFSSRRITYAADTYFDDTECTNLETSTGGSAGMFPPRSNQYLQSFPGATADVAWQRHLEGETYVMSRFGARFQPLTLSFEEILLKGIRMRMEYVRAIPFYPFRALYWFFISRSRLANRTVEQQFPFGPITS